MGPEGMFALIADNGGTEYGPVSAPAGAPADAVAAEEPAGAPAEVVPLAAGAAADVEVPVGAAAAAEAWRLCAWAWGPWALTSSTERVATKRADSAFKGNMVAESGGQAAEGATRNADVVVWNKEQEDARWRAGEMMGGALLWQRALVCACRQAETHRFIILPPVPPP